MSRVVRWDPFRDMISMRNQMDQVMNEWIKAYDGSRNDGGRNDNGENGSGENGSGHPYGPSLRLPLDVSENDDSFFVKASLPGIDPSELDISFSDNTLTIQGEIRQEFENENEKFHLRERRFGSYSRSINLPVAVEADGISANYENGVLTLTLPKAEETKPRKITVQANGNGQRVVEG